MPTAGVSPARLRHGGLENAPRRRDQQGQEGKEVPSRQGVAEALWKGHIRTLHQENRGPTVHPAWVGHPTGGLPWALEVRRDLRVRGRSFGKPAGQRQQSLHHEPLRHEGTQ